MAKHNFVLLNGQVMQEPKLFKDSETGKYIRAICPIKTIRGVRDFGNNIDHIKYDVPIIMSGSPEMVEKMAKWQVGDMVEVKGAITTKDIIKSTTCKCGHKNKRKGNIVFINPIYVEIHERGLNEKQGIEALKGRCEISNLVTVIGPVCREPQLYKTENGLYITTYQMAIRRKYRIKDDSAEIRTDFPWIKSYGAIAANDGKINRKGAYIFVDGMIQTRKLERIQKCEQCGLEYTWNDSATEIVPFAVEYLRDYNTKEEIDEKEKAEGQRAAQDVLNEDYVDNQRPADAPDYECPNDEKETKSIAESVLNEN